jgi:hypothetical protein
MEDILTPVWERKQQFSWISLGSEKTRRILRKFLELLIAN